ncbi:hypothetical protein ONS95_007376 [Cadophora gregata]|uniref:uncharacterized protein n=1 Tax=Cadophora gregata TaxID=51156 RepID=UPI0026DB7A93|nr:uncharacterized protein ONS95_007376 [Cadophora gregata]KAK0125742.1 hypothetical protein ONS95_007376 [Cadophora gregata]
MQFLDSISDGEDTPSTESTVVPPSAPSHTHTVIVLHGREDFGEDLAKSFFDSKSSQNESMAELFPAVRWVFPTAKLRYSAQRDYEFSNSSFAEALKGEEIISQWFDVWDIKEPNQKKDLMIPGLSDSILQIIRIVQEEAKMVPLSRIVLGGISQGCATAILALVASGINLGGFFGLCSWLPFNEDIASMFASHDEKGNISRSVRNLLRLPPIGSREWEPTEPEKETPNENITNGSIVDAAFERLAIGNNLTTPIFLVHSMDDETVPLEMGRELYQTIKHIGFEDIRWKEYEDGGHWIHPKLGVDDMAGFLKHCFKRCTL